jgi:hypothetical protein
MVTLGLAAGYCQNFLKYRFSVKYDQRHYWSGLWTAWAVMIAVTGRENLNCLESGSHSRMPGSLKLLYSPVLAYSPQNSALDIMPVTKLIKSAEYDCLTQNFKEEDWAKKNKGGHNAS